MEYSNYVTYIAHKTIIGNTITDNALPNYKIVVEVTYMNGEVLRIF